MCSPALRADTWGGPYNKIKSPFEVNFGKACQQWVRFMAQFGTGILKKLSLGCLALLLLGLAGYDRMPSLVPPNGFLNLKKVPATTPPVAEIYLPLTPPTCQPDACLSPSSPSSPVLPDQAPRPPVHIVRSESYQRLEQLINKYATRHGVDEALVWAVIRRESNFNPGAVSPKGAMGLMQLMPGTAAMLGVKDAFDVEQNIQGGIKYLEMCLARFGQDVSLALAAYNAGPGNVDKYQGCPPFPETIEYVKLVLKDYGQGFLRSGLRISPRQTVVVEEASPFAVPPGLLWRVPIPRWKVPEPQVKVSQPMWRVPRNLVISAVK